MAITDILTVLTHNSGQVFNTVVTAGLAPIDLLTRAAGAAVASTANASAIFLNAFLKGLTS